MYEAFYGLSAKPFQLNPDPAFYFDSKQHRKAKAYLDYGLLRNEGFVVVTGEIGAGKTTLLRGLLDRLDGDRVCVAQLVTTQLDASDTLHMIGAAFGVPMMGRSKAELLTTLEAFFVSRAAMNRRCLLIVDEAQNLGQAALEELRMLSNYQLGAHSMMQAFLVGQPEFRRTLRRPDMEQLRQRIAAACHLGALDLEDTRLYIEHRLKCAGAEGRPGFEPECFEAVFAASQGVPRRINSLCDRLLLHGYLAGVHTFGAGDVHEVVAEFEAETRSPYPPDHRPSGPPEAHDDHRIEELERRLRRLELGMQRLLALQRDETSRDDSPTVSSAWS